MISQIKHLQRQVKECLERKEKEILEMSVFEVEMLLLNKGCRDALEQVLSLINASDDELEEED